MGEITPAEEEPLDLDMLMASLAADARDVDVFFQVLGVKLAGALGDRVTLERERGMFRHDRPVRLIRIDLGTDRYEAERDRGRIVCRRVHTVRGIALSAGELPVQEWLSRLVKALADEARSSQETWQALRGLLT